MAPAKNVRGIGAEREAGSLEDFLHLPETKPAREYQGGKITAKVSPQGKHSILQLELVIRLNSAAASSRSGIAFPELRCTFAGRSIVPDVAYLAWDRIPRDASGEVSNEFFLAPDLAIEIASPDQEIGVLAEKLAFCAENGARLGWLIDPEKKQVTVFRPEGRSPPLARGTLSAEPVLPGVSFSIEEIFGWLVLPR